MQNSIDLLRLYCELLKSIAGFVYKIQFFIKIILKLRNFKAKPEADALLLV